MSTGCCMETNLTINFIYLIKKKKKEKETTGVGEGVEKMEHLRTFGGNANWCSHSGKQYEGSSKY